MSIFEELQAENTEYPENQRTFQIPPSAYVTALNQHISSHLLDKLNHFASEDQFEESIKLANAMAETLVQNNSPLSLPLKRLLFSKDKGVRLPLCDDFSLTSPYLITNDKTAKSNFFKNLKFELQTADSFHFMVSFIRNSGLQLLLNPLESFRVRQKKGRILTSVYMNITQPSALRKLLEQEHIETKVYMSSSESFHTKAYLFERHIHRNSSALIGSSNISHAALISGEEWSVKVPRVNSVDIYDRAIERFEKLWVSDRTVPLTEELISEYEEYLNSCTSLQKPEPIKSFDSIDRSHASQPSNSAPLSPNKMQQEALTNLHNSRKRGDKRAVAIAATGTGKTFLAAFDAHQFGAKRVLFLAHRDELLESAITTYSAVFDEDDLCGKFTGKVKQTNKRFLFSTVQTLSRESTLAGFAQDAFDYIVVDEFHHAQADTYQRIIDHFTPKFLLGMTATPERMDGRDVLKLCDYNIVCDIRLKEALSLGLLAPFHYFGVADETVDYEGVERSKNGQYVEAQLVNRLNTVRRVDYIIEQMERFGFKKQQRCVLGFCINREHADFMSQSFNAKGIVSTVLTGFTEPRERQSAIKNLQDSSHPLEVIFTVDIFNEGVDIPKLNILLFLRPTESSTIFIQQLGRGLRKSAGKEYVTVLDFIGNYQNSYMVPLALSGESSRRDFDKSSLKRAVSHEFSDLPAGCYVELDEIAKDKIISKLDSIRLDRADYLKQLYLQFKKELGSSPEILDFFTSESAPNPNFFFSKFGSLYKTKIKCGDKEGNQQELSNKVYLQEVAERLESLTPIKWPYEFVILLISLEQKSDVITVQDIEGCLNNYFNQSISSEQHTPLINSAMQSLSMKHKNMDWSFGSVEDGQFVVDQKFMALVDIDGFPHQYVSDRIHFGLKNFRRNFKPAVFLGSGSRFIHYQNYTRNDIQFLSQDTAARGSWREGVKRVGSDYFLFINLNKDQDVDTHLHYKDYFLDPSTFHWQSQNQTSHSSKVGQDYIHHKEKRL